MNLAWDASSDPTVVGYSVYYGPGPGNYTNRLDAGAALTLTTPALADGTYYFSATSRNANGMESDFANVVSTNISTTVIGTAPAITMQPTSAIVDPGASATFNVTATGSAPLSYQWLFNSIAIAGSTASSLSIDSVQTSNVGTYACSISNSAGAITSSDATLAIGTYIVSDPSSQTINATSNLLLTVSVGGTIANTYQWSKDGSPIVGATNATYSVSSALRTDGGTYTVAVTGNRTVVSSPAVVTVIDPVFYLQPVGHALMVGQSYTFTASATGTLPLSYQWYVVKSGSTDLLVNQTNTSLTLTSVTTNDAGVYYCVANNGNYVQSSNAVLSVSAIAGTYNGLFANTTNMLNASSGSLLNFVVNTNGTYSGKIDIAGTAYSLSGVFNSAASSSNLVTRSKGNVVVLLWQDLPFGTISGNVSCAAEGWSVPLRAQVTRYSSSNPTQASGNNVNFIDWNNVFGGQAFITNTVAGAVKMSGKLADSTKISVNASLASTDEFPVHIDLYRRTGMLHGWIQMTNGIPDGALMWIKPGVPNDTLKVVAQP
ncbi:MAG: immunoglobulin domain-containing protein [Limisphaerales bacterium]